MNIDVKFAEDDKKFNVGNFVNMQPINMKFWDATVIHDSEIETYTGPYQITPMFFQQQILETSNKKMSDNVTVLEITYQEASNPQGGYTISIGG